MASVSNSQTCVEFDNCPRTPNSERSWRHWPSFHRSNHKSPVTLSEGRLRFWRTSSTKYHTHTQTVDDNGSPTKRERRGLIADLFDDIPSPKKSRERSWSISGRSTGSRSNSPSKEDVETGESPTRLRRGKSISNLFNTTLRGNTSQATTAAYHSCSHKRPSLSHLRRRSQDTNVKDNPPSLSSAQFHSRITALHERLQNEQEEARVPDTTGRPPIYQVYPIISTINENSDRGEDNHEQPPDRTVVTVQEISPPADERRNCSASNATWGSNAPTLSEATLDGYIRRDYNEDDRSRTPNSYLQELVQACESPSGASSKNQDRASLTPSPAKYNAVQPLDFLAGKCTPPLESSNGPKLGSTDFRWSPLSGLDTMKENQGDLGGEEDSVPELPVSWFEHEVTDRPKRQKKVQFKDDDPKLTWDVGNPETNLRRRLQERNERYRIMETDYDSSHNLDKALIARSIKLTVAKMTKNFHMNRSSEEEPSSPAKDEPIRLWSTLPLGKDMSPQLGRSYQFGMNSSDVQDSMARGRQILQEIQTTTKLSTTPAKCFPSPVIQAKDSIPADRMPSNTPKLRSPVEPGIRLPGFCEANSVLSGKSCNSDETARLHIMTKFTESLEPKALSCCLIPSTSTKDTNEQGMEQMAISPHSSIGEELAYNETDVEEELTPGGSKVFREVIWQQPDHADDWLQESLKLKSLCEPFPAFPEPSKIPANNHNNTFPPTYIIEDIMQDSRDLRNPGNPSCRWRDTNQPGSPSRKGSNSARRRVVSTASVHVQFPGGKNTHPYTQTFETKSKAVAALYDYKLEQLSNFVIYNPTNRILRARNFDAPVPNQAELQKKGLELVWLPLQQNSLFEAVLLNSHDEERSESSTQGQQSSDAAYRGMPQSMSMKHVSGTDVLGSSTSLMNTETEVSDLERVHDEVSEKMAESTLPNIDEQDDFDVPTWEPEWTASDEEYVVEVDSDIARGYLGSQYSDSIRSTPRLERETLLNQIPHIALDGEDIFFQNDQAIQLKGTKTWPQLAREFKSRHPELFPLGDHSTISKEFQGCFSMVDSDSSFEFDSSNCFSKDEEVLCPNRDLTESNHGHNIQGTACSGINSPPALEDSADDLSAMGLSYVIPTVAHIEYANRDEHILAKQATEAPGAPKNPNKECNEQVVQESAAGITNSCCKSQCGTEKEQQRWRQEQHLWESWIEAELAQASLFQTDIIRREQELRTPRQVFSTIDSENTCSTKPELGCAEKSNIPSHQSVPSLDKVADPAPIGNRSSSAASFAAGFPFTMYGESMLQESSENMANMKHAGTDPDSSNSQKTTRTAKNDSCEKEQVKKLRGFENPLTDMRSGLANSQNAIPRTDRVAEKSGLLEAMTVSSAQTLNSVTPEDLNIRLVGKAARNSELGRSSRSNVSSLIDIFKSHGLMLETKTPILRSTSISPRIGNQSSSQPVGSSTRLTLPTRNRYSVSPGLSTSGQSNTTLPRLTPAQISSLSDTDTELDPGFGEELARVKKH